MGAAPTRKDVPTKKLVVNEFTLVRMIVKGEPVESIELWSGAKDKSHFLSALLAGRSACFASDNFDGADRCSQAWVYFSKKGV